MEGEREGKDGEEGMVERKNGRREKWMGEKWMGEGWWEEGRWANRWDGCMLF